MKLQFLGAAGTVTGSKYLLTINDKRILIDCGLYQGVKNLRRRNWQSMPVAANKIDAVILTHAHIDHTGYLPALIKAGFNGPVYSSKGTHELSKILLPDAGFLQEEDARYANKKKFSRHSVAEPLFTEEDARKSLGYFHPKEMNVSFELFKDINACFYAAGHILGANFIELSTPEGKVVFSGDIGRPNSLMMYPPTPLKEADYIIVESTYGDRTHLEADTATEMKQIINETIERGGSVLIPAFAVGRAQVMLYYIQQLMEAGDIPKIPVFLNSPMAISATELYTRKHHSLKWTKADCEKIDSMTTFIRTAEESIDLNNKNIQSIIISASGMASGGRVLHHLKTMLRDTRHSIVFAGFQAPGTRGDALVNGKTEVKIHGEYHQVRAQIHNLESLSAHADYKEILEWLKNFEPAPKRTFVTHGEAVAADEMRLHIKDQLGWRACVPEYLEEFELGNDDGRKL